MEITKREVLFSVAIIAVLLTIGMVISNKISDKMMDDNYKYNTAVKITSNEQFKYGMDTSVGNAFVYGTMTANEPVTYDDIKDNYLSVKQVKEIYTMHTRTVTTTDANGHTSSHVETYWTWDYAGEDYRATEQVTFCDQVLDYNKIKPIDGDYITTKTYGYTRYKYYGCPIEITGSLFAKLENNTISDDAFFMRDKTIDESIEALNSKTPLIIFWVLWSIFIIAAVIGFYYIDNRWLEG